MKSTEKSNPIVTAFFLMARNTQIDSPYGVAFVTTERNRIKDFKKENPKPFHVWKVERRLYRLNKLVELYPQFKYAINSNAVDPT